MFTRFLSAASTTTLFTSDSSGSHTFTFPDSRQAAIYFTSPAIVPYCTYALAAGGETKLVEMFGAFPRSFNSGMYVALLNGIAGESYTLSWTVGVRLTAVIQAQDPTMVLALGSSVGPISISTKCYGAVYPFTAIFIARPLFLSRFPLLDSYVGNASTIALSGLSALVGQYEHTAIEYATNQLLRFKISYEYNEDYDVGKVVSLNIRSPYTASSTVPAYSLVADLVVAVPEDGLQSYDSTQDNIVGAENPTNYLQKRYVPSPAYTNSMEYLPIQPVSLTAGEDAIESCGRVMFERSNLYSGEAMPMRYVVNCIVKEGAGQVMVSPDYAPKFSELSEYEF